LIDGPDRGIRVGICSKQCALRFGEDPHSFLQKRDTIHVWHALVGKEQGHAIIAHL
jgi:hypothetical protein